MRLTVSYALFTVALASTLPAAAVQRTFVASYGSDANVAANCTFAHPCRGFQAAHGITDSGGEVIAIDAAGYGAVTITKSISLIGNSGFYAGISVSTGTGVTIATPSVSVILRGLNINGTGGDIGLDMTDGSALTIEGCVFSNFTTTAIRVSAPAQVRITNTTVRDSFDGVRIADGANASVSQARIFGNGEGIFATTTSATTTTLSISDSTVSNNGLGIGSFTGLDAGARSVVSVTRTTSSNNYYGAYVNSGGAGGGTASLGIIDSTVTHNQGTGLNNDDGVLETFGRNFVRYNGTATSGTITTVPPL